MALLQAIVGRYKPPGRTKKVMIETGYQHQKRFLEEIGTTRLHRFNKSKN